ncbi:MAG: DNA primase [Candidatus Campbellbacteria bacterium]|nr:DNA primase [Candidatus Campbellbacteria bacterium]
MNSPVEEIKNRLSVEEVIGSYIELKSHGKTLKALCPFHQEKTPSFVVSPERQSFYCFGCNRGGDIFTFVEEFEGVDFKGALKILSEKAGIDVKLYANDPEAKERIEILHEILDEASKAYRDSYLSSEIAQEYIQNRGITAKISESFNIGFAPDSWSFIHDKLIKKGFKAKDLEAAGLLIEKKNGGYYDRFRNRVMFPINDSSGRVVGFSGRTLSGDEKTAKYINTPETEVFKKRDILFGIDKAKLSIRKLGFAILVEGQMDLVLSHQVGFRNTVATSGTALRGQEEGKAGVSNLELVKRISKNLVIAFDSDKAGKEAAVKNATLALSLGMDVKIAELPDDKDPADMILDDKEKWKAIIKNSKDLIQFQIDEINQKAKSKKDILKRIRDEVFSTIAVVPSSIEKEYYLNSVSEVLGMRSETVFEEFESFINRTQRPKAQNETKVESDSKEDLKWNNKLFIAAKIDVYNKKELALNDDQKNEIGQGLSRSFEEIFEESPEDSLNSADIKEKEKYLFESEAGFKSLQSLQKDVEYLLNRIKIQSLEREARIILQKIKEAENEGDKSKASTSLEEYEAVSKKLQSLKDNV